MLLAAELKVSRPLLSLQKGGAADELSVADCNFYKYCLDDRVKNRSNECGIHHHSLAAWFALTIQ